MYSCMTIPEHCWAEPDRATLPGQHCRLVVAQDMFAFRAEVCFTIAPALSCYPTHIKMLCKGQPDIRRSPREAR